MDEKRRDQVHEWYRGNLLEAEKFLDAAYVFAGDLGYTGDVEQLDHILTLIRAMEESATARRALGAMSVD